MNNSDCYEGAANVIYNGMYLSMQLMQILFDCITIILVLFTRNYICKRLINKDAIVTFLFFYQIALSFSF